MSILMVGQIVDAVTTDLADAYDIRTSPASDLVMYGDVIETYREHIELTGRLGDYATAQMLREQLEGLEEHAHVIDHYLEDDTLVLASATNGSEVS